MNILPEHRNMPLEDAINLLARNFDAYLLREKASRPSEVSVVPATGPLTAVNLTDRHPEAIQVSILLNLFSYSSLMKFSDNFVLK